MPYITSYSSRCRGISVNYFKARDLEIPLILIFFARYLNFAKIRAKKFREIFKSVHKIAKFKYFAKVITYSKSPDYVLQSYI